MICAPAAERPASVGDEGRKAASDVRTAQMITRSVTANSESVLGEFTAESTVSTRRSRIRRVVGNLGYQMMKSRRNSERAAVIAR